MTTGLEIQGLCYTNHILGLTFTASLLSSSLVSCSPLVGADGELKSPAANKVLLTLVLGVMLTGDAEVVDTGLAALGATTLAAEIWLGTVSFVLLLKLKALVAEAAAPAEDPRLNKPPVGGAKLNGAPEGDG